jgi:hypothetical protein
VNAQSVDPVTRLVCRGDSVIDLSP